MMSNANIQLWTMISNLLSTSAKSPLERSQERALKTLDGCETVYVKVMGVDRKEYTKNYAPGRGTWIVKVRGNKPKLEDVLVTHGECEAGRLGLLPGASDDE